MTARRSRPSRRNANTLKSNVSFLVLAALLVAAIVAAVRGDASVAGALGFLGGAVFASLAYSLLVSPQRAPSGRQAAKPTGYTSAAMLAFARATPALLLAVSDSPAGWLDGIAARDRRTLAAAGVLHVDPAAGLTLTAAGYTLASRL